MAASSPAIEWALFLVLLPLALLMIWRGFYILRGGQIDRESVEYGFMLARFNVLNSLLRLPLQRRLTRRQLRVAAVLYLAAGLAALLAVALGLRKLLP